MTAVWLSVLPYVCFAAGSYAANQQSGSSVFLQTPKEIIEQARQQNVPPAVAPAVAPRDMGELKPLLTLLYGCPVDQVNEYISQHKWETALDESF